MKPNHLPELLPEGTGKTVNMFKNIPYVAMFKIQLHLLPDPDPQENVVGSLLTHTASIHKVLW